MTDRPDMRALYVAKLREHAHIMIAMGYQSLDATSFSKCEETAITGELVRTMNDFLEADDSPDWTQLYSIADDPPLNAPGKLGRSRSRVDIEFQQLVPGKRPRLRFEAKRLGTTSGHTVTTYLGPEGMGCFLSGKYPTTHDEAGMLGYVQSNDEQYWVDRIEKGLVNKGEKYSVVPPLFHRQHICSLEHTYVSHHQQIPGSQSITIHHILLRFH